MRGRTGPLLQCRANTITLTRRSNVERRRARRGGWLAPSSQLAAWPVTGRRYSLGAVSQLRATGSRCLPEHRSQTVVLTFEPIRGDDGELRVDHFLPDTESGRALAASVRSGETPGLSVEFHALDSAVVSGVREIRQSLVTAVAVVQSGSYDAARAEVRHKQRRAAWWLR